MTVARFAVQLFDSTKKLHKLGGKERTLLEVAGLLHDIGYYVGITDYHKHSYYLIKASPVPLTSKAAIQAALTVSFQSLGSLNNTTPE